MNQNIELGVINTLKINRATEPGIFLEAKDEEVVLLPNKFITNDMQIDETIDVFIYTDSEDRIVATTQEPYIMKDQYACLEIVDIAKFGAFLDMGLDKDLLIPKNKLKLEPKVGKSIVVKMVEDERTRRLIATQRFELNKKARGLAKNDEVEILVYAKTPLGFKVIVNDKYDGMIFHNEIFTKIKIGKKTKAYVKNLREDGKLDISIQKVGFKGSDESSNLIIQKLEENGGELDFTYKSDAEEIKDFFGISKKNFKATLTKLINDKKIELKESSISLK